MRLHLRVRIQPIFAEGESFRCPDFRSYCHVGVYKEDCRRVRLPVLPSCLSLGAYRIVTLGLPR